MKYILEKLQSSEAVNSIINGKSGLGNLSIANEALLLASAYLKQPKTYFVVKSNTYQAQKLYEALSVLLTDEVLLFTCEESLRIEAIATSPQARVSQLEVMAKLGQDKPYICIINTMALIRYQPSPKMFNQHVLKLKIDDEISINELKRILMEAGYSSVSKVDTPLTYASRGGIVDVYSVNYEHPLRIEFFDTIVDSIRFFDATSQRTIEKLNEIEILPANTLLFTPEELVEMKEKATKLLAQVKPEMNLGYADLLEEHVLDDLDKIANYSSDAYLYRYYGFLSEGASIIDYQKDAMIIISNLDDIKDQVKHIMQESITYLQELFQEGQALARFSIYQDLERLLKKHHHFDIKKFQDYKHPVDSEFILEDYSQVGREQLIEELKLQSKNQCILICLENNELQELSTYFPNIELFDGNIKPGIYYCEQLFHDSLSWPKQKVMIISSKDLLKKKKVFTRYANKFNDAEVLKSYQELHVGDYVVHHSYGIGKYLGIETKKVDGFHKDFLKIAYRGDDILYVPVEHFDFVRKFVSKEGVTPKLNKLGSKEWEKTKKKVSEKVALLAQRLVNLYANREENIGYAFEADDELQEAFEDDFPFQLTIDQQRSILEIKQDMQSSKPMDRLLCGDVGFGKTEVAACAAFKAASQGKQVAYLCPTTILSNQHYKTFKQRFKNFPLRIELVNRFVKAKDFKIIQQDLANGKIDIIIGTHRLLSKTLCFKDLGLLIIDEEQRFGVEQKEKIKEITKGVDVLSLSATPIPRTMQMSLVGVRSMSHLDTPPLNRLPIQTYVIEKRLETIKDIIEKELARNGQVFYLFNNVEEIYILANKLRELLPSVNIGVAHGQMSKNDIEDVMIAFNNHEYQILVCTTIIETGIDIPNANTMIIDQADRFGLAQLYQIRGRVGRSDRLAYCYLMYDQNKQLSEVASKRLNAIKEFVQLGSGYKVAMRDLTIRGAGDMLGPQQSGFIDTIGLDMYMEMLNDAILEQKGEKKEEVKKLRKSMVKMDAYIPQKFEEEDYEKLTLYQKIDQIVDREQLKQVYDEVVDMYGKLPDNVKMLFDRKMLDIMISEPFVDKFDDDGKVITIVLSKEFSNNLDGVAFFKAMSDISRDIKIRYNEGKITLNLNKKLNWLNCIFEILSQCQTMC